VSSEQERARRLAALTMVALALASAIVGAALDRLLVRVRSAPSVLADSGFHPLVSILRSPTDEERRRVRAQLASDLGLSPRQARSVDSVFDAHAGEFRALREEIRPRVEQLTSSVRRDVEKFLTPAQRTRYQQLSAARTPSPQDSGR
jgi:hypothetical protein